MLVGFSYITFEQDTNKLSFAVIMYPCSPLDPETVMITKAGCILYSYIPAATIRSIVKVATTTTATTITTTTTATRRVIADTASTITTPVILATWRYLHLAANGIKADSD